jgi:large repetitive protein
MIPHRKHPPGRGAGARSLLLAGLFVLLPAALPAAEWRLLRGLAGPRQYHTATLLPDGKVLFAGGILGNRVERDLSLYDPQAGTLAPAVAALRQARFRHTATLLPGGAVLIAGGEDARHQPLASAELYLPAAKKLLKLPPLSTPRKGHTATLLENGDVLIIGGGTHQLELFDSKTRKFQSIGQIERVRQYHTATLLPDGRILVAGGGDASVEWLNPAAGTHGSAPLTRDRAQHTATLLPDGRVLLAGGGAGAELFDPAVNASTPVPWPENRRLHTAALLPDGRVLLAGGRTDAPLDTAYYFDPGGPGFVPAPPLHTPRAGHTAVFLASGALLVYGGAAAPAELFCPVAGAFQAGAALQSPRRDHTATLLPSGEVLLAGGSDGAGLKQAEVFDPVRDAFRPAGAMNLPRTGHTATLLPTGQVLLAGGVTGGHGSLRAEVYNPGAGVFAYASASQLHEPRARHTATLLADGRVLLAGGEDRGRGLASAEIFESVHGAFKHTAGLSAARAYHSATRLQDGSVLLAGGLQGAEPLASAEIFFPARGAFERTGDLGTARARHGAVLLATGKVLILGGEGAGGKLDSCEFFDPVTRSFAPGPDLPEARVAPAVAVLPNGEVLVAGGGIPETDVYFPEANGFGRAPALAQARQGASATLLLDGRVLVAGGEARGIRLASSEWAFAAEGQKPEIASLARPEISRAPAVLQPGQTCVLTGRNFSSIKSGAPSAYPPMPVVPPRLCLQALESGSAQGLAVGGPWLEVSAVSAAGDWGRADSQAAFILPADLPWGFFALRILKQGAYSPARVVVSANPLTSQAITPAVPERPEGAGAGTAPAAGKENDLLWSEDFNGPLQFRPAGWKDASVEKALGADMVNCGTSCARVSKQPQASWGRVLSPALSCDLNAVARVEVKVKSVTPGVQWNVGLKEEHSEGYWPMGEYAARPQTLVLDLAQWVRLTGHQDFRLQINLLAKPGKSQAIEVDSVKVFVRPQLRPKAGAQAL